MDENNVIEALARIERRIDKSHQLLCEMQEKQEQNHRQLLQRASIAGGLSGGLFAAGVSLLKAKFGLGG